MRIGLAASVLFCVLALSARAEESSALRLPSSRISLEPDDTLEFVLSAKASPQHAPNVQAWLLPSSAEKPAADATPAARAFVTPSPKPNEWLVHVRGLQAARGTSDLFVRWSPGADDPDAAHASRGETRLPGAVSIKAEAADVVLLMDGSLSMSRTDPKRLRVEAAREFIAQARRSGSVGRIAIVQFDSKSRTVLNLTGVNENIEDALEKIDERGETDIDGGIRHSLAMLTEAGAIVLLTDGKQEPGIYRNAHEEARKAGIAIHTLALGHDADRELLKRIAAETGGTYSDAAKDRDLTLAYSAIASRIARVRTILAVESAAAPATFPVDGACRSLAVSVGGEHSGSLTVAGPATEAWTSPAQAAPSFFRDAPKSGAWTATWNGPASPLTAAARTSLYPQFFRADLEGDRAVVLDTDEPSLALSLADNAAPLAARVEATLAFTNGPAQPLALHDDGQNGDLRANDGVSARVFRLPRAAPIPNPARGTVRVVVEGQREGVPFRRETQAPFVFRRHLGAALLAGGTLDFGTHYSGESAQLEIPLRARGPGGMLTARLLPPQNPAQHDFTRNAELANVPAQLAPRQQASAALKVAIGNWQEPGLYGGIAELELTGAERVRIPWTVRVQAPALRAPKQIDVGLLNPGQSFDLSVPLSVDGGTATIDSIELATPWRTRELFSSPPKPALIPGIDLSLTPPNLPIRITRDAVTHILKAAVAPDATGGALHARLILRDSARRQIAAIPVVGHVASQYLQTDLPIQFGAVEAGDSLNAIMSWSLRGLGSKNVDLRERSQLSLTSIATLMPKTVPLPSLEGNARQQFDLAIPADAPPGNLSGVLSLEVGPALIQRRWSVNIVAPHLSVEPAALDFGTLAPGQKKSLSTALTTFASKPVPVAARIAKTLAKPKLTSIHLDDANLTFSVPPEERPAGTPASFSVTLDIPDNAQDGLYTGAVEISSRLGVITLPIQVNIVSPIAVAPFHVTPTNVLLHFETADSEPPSDTFRVVSHSDADQTLVLRMQADGSEKICANLLLDPKTNFVADTTTLTLPARATLDVLVRAEPGAQSGARSHVIVAGDTDQLSVNVLVERPRAAAIKIAPEEPSRLLNWLLLFVAFALLLLGYLIRNLLKTRWVRYAVYSVLIHLAVLPLLMPKQTVMEALPASIQISLLESEATLGMELSEQQQRRLDALQSGSEAPPGVREQPMLADAPLSAPGLPDAKGGDAPSKAELEKRAGEDVRAVIANVPQPVRVVSHEVADRPLDADALQAPEPAPKSVQPVENTVTARTATTLADRFNDAPLPAAPQHTDVQPERAAADLPLAAFTETAPVRPIASPAPAADRPALTGRDRTAALDDAPLQLENLPAEISTKPSVQVAPDAERVRDLAAHGSLELAGSSAVALPTLALPSATQAESRPTESTSRAIQLPATAVGERSGTQHPTPQKSGAFATGFARPAVTAGTGVSDGGDAPLDAGPRLGAAPQLGSTASTAADHGATAISGEGPRTARGSSLTSTSGTGSIQDFAAALERSAVVAGGGASPRNGNGTLDRSASLGDEHGRGNGTGSGNSFGAGSGAGSTRPNRGGSGDALDAAPLDAGGGLGTMALGKPGGNPRGTSLTENGRGTAAGGLPGGTGNGTGAGKGLGTGEGMNLAQFSGALGAPQLGATARPSDRSGSAFKTVINPNLLDTRPAGGPGGGKFAATQKGVRLMNSPTTSALLKVNVGLAKHSGDWNSSPTALYNLRNAFLERCGIPDVEFKVNTTSLSDVKSMLQNRTIMITSNDPIVFKPEEIAAMREYMAAGGTLWVNDSSASDSNVFDAAFRTSIEGLIPGAKLAPLEMDHPFFNSCYDLRKGFKGYRVPPGDKYRVNYIEALLTPDGRAPLIYTRNDYADGLEIDPRMSAGGKSLTDLTNAEMQEASLRFSINLVAYSMQGAAPKMPPPPEGAAEFEKVYRYSGPELPKFDDFSVVNDQWQKPVWLAEKEWCNPTEMQFADDAEMKSKVVRVEFKGGSKFKGAVTRNLPADFGATRALVMDLNSSLGSGFNVAILFYTKEGRSFETRPIFIRPGLNRNVRFPLDMGDMKSSASNPPWKDYDQPFTPRNTVQRFTFLFYNLNENGAVKIGAIHEQK